MRLEDLYNRVSSHFSSNPNDYKNLKDKIISLFNDYTLKSANSDQGYCFKFNLIESAQDSIMKYCDLTPYDLNLVFKTEWGTAALSNRMHADTYYQIYLFLIYLFFKKNERKLLEICLSLILFKIWNGRKSKFIQFCNKDIMNYVTRYMCNKKHLANRYENPYLLITQYFTPTLLNTYFDRLKVKPAETLKNIFEQGFTRIRQMFVFRNRVDINTGENVADGGLLPLYMKAKKEGYSIQKISVKYDEENPVKFSDLMSSSNLEEIITTTVNNIALNPNPKYSEFFINNLLKDYKISKKIVDEFIKHIHKSDNSDNIHEIFSLILKKLNILNKDQICAAAFMTNLNKEILSSKNNETINKINLRLNDIISRVLRESVNRELHEYSNVHILQMRKLVIRILIYNLKQVTCKSE